MGRGPSGFYLGYRGFFLVDLEGFPLDHVEAPANVNEKRLVGRLLEEALGDVGDGVGDWGQPAGVPERVFHLLEERKILHLIPWRRLRGREIPPGVLRVKNRI